MNEIRKILCGSVLSITLSAMAVSASAGAGRAVPGNDDGTFVVESMVASTPVASEDIILVAESLGTVAADRSAAAVGADGSIHVAAIQLAAVTPAGDDDGADPLEGLNRAIFGFNEVVYDSLFRPIAKTYNAYVPKTVRSGVGNILNNINAPVVLANDIMQFEFHRALTTIARFLVNSTAGIFGIADAATEIGLVDHKEDFGQTLGFYGIGEGLYLVLPIFGPSNPRDAVGKFLVDPLLDPFGQYLSNTGRDAESYARTGMDGLKEYAGLIDELDQIKKTSVDYYAAIRSLYRQKRKGEIANGRQEDLPPIPNYNLNFLPTEDGSVARSN